MTPIRSVSTVLALSFVLMTLPGIARSDDFMVGVRGGYYSQVDKPFLGGEILAKVAPHFWFNPNVEYVFVDSGTFWTFNGDFHYDFPTHSDTYVWLGAGPALVYSHPDRFPSHSDLAADILGGIGIRAGHHTVPYLQLKAIIKSDTIVSLAVGIRF